MAGSSYISNQIAIERLKDDREKSASKEREAKNKRMQELFLNELAKEENYQKNVVHRHYDSPGEAFTSMWNATAGQETARRDAIQKLKQQMSDVNSLIDRAEEEAAQNGLEQDWHNQNSGALREFYTALPHLSPERAKAGLQEFLNNWGAVSGTPAMVEHVDTERGFGYARLPGGQIMKIDFSEEFPDIAAEHTRGRALAASTGGHYGYSGTYDALTEANRQAYADDVAARREGLSAKWASIDARNRATEASERKAGQLEDWRSEKLDLEKEKMSTEYMIKKNLPKYIDKQRAARDALNASKKISMYLDRTEDLIREVQKVRYLPNGRGLVKDVVRKWMRNLGLSGDYDSVATQYENSLLPILNTMKTIFGARVTNFDFKKFLEVIPRITDDPRAAAEDIKFLRKNFELDMNAAQEDYDSLSAMISRTGVGDGLFGTGGAGTDSRPSGSTGAFNRGVAAAREMR